jgi:hypothetical protein
MKERCIDFGKEQITELVKHMASDQAVYKGTGEDQHFPVQEWVRRLFETDRVPTVIEKEAVVIEKQQEALARLLLQKATNESHLPRAKMNPEKLKRLEKKMAKNGDDIEKKNQSTNTKAQQKRISKSIDGKKSKREAGNHPEQPAPKRLKTEADPVLSRSDWSAMVDMVARKIFSVPARVALRWTGTVTIDGVRAHWHCLRGPLGGLGAAKKLKTSKNRKPKDAKKKKPVKKRKRTDQKTTHPEHDNTHTTDPENEDEKDTFLVEALRPTHYGVHKSDVNFGGNLGPINIIAVDPGHVNLIDAVRVHVTPDSFGLPQPATSTNPRKYKLQSVHLERKRSVFGLSNKQWQFDGGRSHNREREIKLQRRLNLQPAIDALASSSSRTACVDEYQRHVAARIATAPAFQRRMKARCPRRWKFESYSKEQRAVEKLSTDLLGGLSPSNTLIVWGNGGFGPTSHGHASASSVETETQLMLSRTSSWRSVKRPTPRLSPSGSGMTRSEKPTN